MTCLNVLVDTRGGFEAGVVDELGVCTPALELELLRPSGVDPEEEDNDIEFGLNSLAAPVLLPVDLESENTLLLFAGVDVTVVDSSSSSPASAPAPPSRSRGGEDGLPITAITGALISRGGVPGEVEVEVEGLGVVGDGMGACKLEAEGVGKVEGKCGVEGESEGEREWEWECECGR
ncbi:hypothetical protein CVT26_008863 [Gymnopilus dilepis]|uniref:Uncharacterized protein n=1 Tax=Gymnopilus dilepis TaxID=231916 RepID=A0A409X4F1_9AGAR|nr:hypothetical protein CVT26_008863 [Gymnopilus dilepis]